MVSVKALAKARIQGCAGALVIKVVKACTQVTQHTCSAGRTRIHIGFTRRSIGLRQRVAGNRQDLATGFSSGRDEAACGNHDVTRAGIDDFGRSDIACARCTDQSSSITILGDGKNRSVDGAAVGRAAIAGNHLYITRTVVDDGVGLYATPKRISDTRKNMSIAGRDGHIATTIGHGQALHANGLLGRIRGGARHADTARGGVGDSHACVKPDSPPRTRGTHQCHPCAGEITAGVGVKTTGSRVACAGQTQLLRSIEHAACTVIAQYSIGGARCSGHHGDVLGCDCALRINTCIGVRGTGRGPRQTHITIGGGDVVVDADAMPSGRIACEGDVACAVRCDAADAVHGIDRERAVGGGHFDIAIACRGPACNRDCVGFGHIHVATTADIQGANIALNTVAHGSDTAVCGGQVKIRCSQTASRLSDGARSCEVDGVGTCQSHGAGQRQVARDVGRDVAITTNRFINGGINVFAKSQRRTTGQCDACGRTQGTGCATIAHTQSANIDCRRPCVIAGVGQVHSAVGSTRGGVELKVEGT